MGIFIHAVDAESGRILWTNSETGSRYTVHPHGATSFGSIVPQGYLAVAGDYLVVPGGRSLPAIFNRKTGELVHFNFGGKSSGGFQVMAAGDCYCVDGNLFQLKDGKPLTRFDASLMTDKEAITLQGDFLQIQSLAGELKTETTTDRKGKKQTKESFSPLQKRFIPRGSDLPDAIFCQAGNQLYLGEKNRVASVALDPQSKEPLKVKWSAALEGTPTTIIAADERLFVVTTDGKLCCYGADNRPVTRHDPPQQSLANSSDEWATKAKFFIEANDSKAGYAVALGIGSGRLIEELIGQTNLHLIAVEADATKQNSLRTRMNRAGLYGPRVTVFAGNPTAFPYPPYFANLMVTEDPAITQQLTKTESLRHVFQALRPYGGVLAMPTTEAQHRAIQQIVSQHADTFAGGELERADDLTLLRRVGPLPRSGEWSHQYGDATNSVVSKDQLVKAPLGVLWFGGPSNDKVLPRHGHGPSPQVAGGRLVIEGPDMLRAVDVYTGRVHWE
ncbi:MAG: PQQ-binding-like beta-propeller repeat protein, partial [Planctomycetaceae bacterium]|nr:PQQ-binding-like beta-propeller repeat protein [Planctomycetaceae bacterium]